MLNLPDAAPDLTEILIQSDTMPWREKSLKGIAEKMLWRDETSGGSIALIRFAKGAGIPQPHHHASNRFMFCLAGRYEYVATGVTLTAGSFYCNPKGHVHGPAIAHEETVVLEIYDGPPYPQKPSWDADALLTSHAHLRADTETPARLAENPPAQRTFFARPRDRGARHARLHFRDD